MLCATKRTVDDLSQLWLAKTNGSCRHCRPRALWPTRTPKTPMFSLWASDLVERRRVLRRTFGMAPHFAVPPISGPVRAEMASEPASHPNDQAMGRRAVPAARKESGSIARVMKQIALGQLVFIVLCVTTVSATSPATSGFRKLQSLSGRWEGKDERGNAVETEFRSVAAGTAVLENLTASGMDEMLTLYSRDRESILLTHYCPTNNQPRMRAVPQTSEIRQLVFSFQDAGNLPNLAVGHEHKLVIDFIDNDHLTERWTWRRDGHDADVVYYFARKNGS